MKEEMMGDVFLDLNSCEWILAFLGLVGDSNWRLLTMGCWMRPSENERYPSVLAVHKDIPSAMADRSSSSC